MTALRPKLKKTFFKKSANHPIWYAPKMTPKSQAKFKPHIPVTPIFSHFFILIAL